MKLLKLPDDIINHICYKYHNPDSVKLLKLPDDIINYICINFLSFKDKIYIQIAGKEISKYAKITYLSDCDRDNLENKIITYLIYFSKDILLSELNINLFIENYESNWYIYEYEYITKSCGYDISLLCKQDRDIKYFRTKLNLNNKIDDFFNKLLLLYFNN